MTTPPTRLQQLKGAMDTLLVVDVFVVIAGALWFAAAVALHSQHVEGPLTLFQKLWEPLFTPAIGLLMGAALLVIGLAILTGFDKTLETALTQAAPSWLVDITTRF